MKSQFDQRLESLGAVLSKKKIEILQVNLGKLCNLTCVHCHVEAGPTKTKENMDRETVEAVVRFMDRSDIQTLDLTGGAPEMNPHFRYLVDEAKKRSVHVIDRCNLSVFYEKGFEDCPDYLAGHQVEIVASLPCYTSDNVDKQRGKGTLDASIRALLTLNQLGYGKQGNPLILNLVYNPVGPHLPPGQQTLEQDYKKNLRKDFGIEFNRLYTITNMPITRYALYLKSTHAYEDYVNLLMQSFNAATLDGLMCRDTLNVSWDGTIYDCDFNQATGMPLSNGKVLNIKNLKLEDLEGRLIMTAEHCFGCTAGSGSSCQGAIE